MLSVPSFLSQSTPSLTISETDSLYIAVTTLHHELKCYAPNVSSKFETNNGIPRGTAGTADEVENPQSSKRGERVAFLPTVTGHILYQDLKIIFLFQWCIPQIHAISIPGICHQAEFVVSSFISAH